MTKRDKGTTRGRSGTAPSAATRATTADAMEQRVLNFAEQLGRIAGTFQAKAEGWMDSEALKKQIAAVRDDAAALLEQLARGATQVATHELAGEARLRARTGRSGGVVDAPGKKHRKRIPRDPQASRVDSQATKMRTARTMVKTNRRRGRG